MVEWSELRASTAGAQVWSLVWMHASVCSSTRKRVRMIDNKYWYGCVDGNIGSNDGVQDKLPQNIEWHIESLKLKESEKTAEAKRSLWPHTPYSSSLKQVIKLPCERYGLYLYQREGRHSYHQRQGIRGPRYLYKEMLLDNLLCS